jgi:hypothetical protein
MIFICLSCFKNALIVRHVSRICLTSLNCCNSYWIAHHLRRVLSFFVNQKATCTFKLLFLSLSAFPVLLLEIKSAKSRLSSLIMKESCLSITRQAFILCLNKGIVSMRTCSDFRIFIVVNML